VVAGGTAALVAVSPRLAASAWAALCAMVLLVLFGPLLGVPGWAERLSPIGWVPAVPADPFDVLPVAGLLAVALTLAAVATAAFRRRDVLG
jgi:ABC-2 type transport system permease protein